MSHVGCNMSHIDCNIFYIDCNISNIDCNISNIDCNMSNVDCNILELHIGHVAIDVGNVAMNIWHVAIIVGPVAITIGHVAINIGHVAINVGQVAIQWVICGNQHSVCSSQHLTLRYGFYILQETATLHTFGQFVCLSIVHGKWTGWQDVVSQRSVRLWAIWGWTGRQMQSDAYEPIVHRTWAVNTAVKEHVCLCVNVAEIISYYIIMNNRKLQSPGAVCLIKISFQNLRSQSMVD